MIVIQLIIVYESQNWAIRKQHVQKVKYNKDKNAKMNVWYY